MSFTGLIIELLVSGLLAVTIGYCMILNKRLKKMRADEDMMRAVVNELVKSTQTAERAILGLRATASECNKTISARLSEAREVAAFLDHGVARARHDVQAKMHNNIARQTATKPPQAPQKMNARPVSSVQPEPNMAQMRHISQQMRQNHMRMKSEPLKPPMPGNSVEYPTRQMQSQTAAPVRPVDDLDIQLSDLERRNKVA